MTEISISGLTKEFEVGSKILDGLSFRVERGERVGILGKNGAGKTTLFRLLTGELKEDAGEIAIAPGRSMGLISQIPVYPPHYTVEDVLETAFAPLRAMEREMEAITGEMAGGSDEALLRRYGELSARYEAGGGYDMATRCNKVCNGLEIPDGMRRRLFSELSGGEKTRVNLGRLILEDTDILLLDEPTNHLDLRATQWLEGYLEHFKGTVLAISHDRWFLDRVVGRVIELVDGKAELYGGNYSFFVEEKERRRREQERQYEKEQAKIRQLEKSAEQLRLWAHMGMDKTYRRAKSMEKRIERLQTTDRPTRERSLEARFGEREFHGDQVLSLKGVGMAFGDHPLFSDVELLVEGGERIALLGDNGAGKSTLIKLIMGEEMPTAGRVRLGPAVKTGYLPQIIRFSHPERDLVDTLIYEQDCSAQTARNRLGAFHFRGEDVFRQVKVLSGGEQSRLRLCMLMDEKINFLILDEPTNHLDIMSREWIEEAVESYDGTLLFVSHDRYFIHRFATRIWMLEGGHITDFRGDYRSFEAARTKAAPPAEAPAEEKEPKEEKPRRPGGTKELEKQVRAAEQAVARAEERQYELTLRAEEVSSNYLELQKIYEEQKALEEEIAHLYTVWEGLEAELEERKG